MLINIPWVLPKYCESGLIMKVNKSPKSIMVMFYLPTITGFKQAPHYIHIYIHLWFIPPEKNMASARKLFQKESSLPMNQLIVNQ